MYDIVSLLPPDDLDALRRAWAGAGALGVTKDLFLDNMLRVRSETAAVFGLF